MVCYGVVCYGVVWCAMVWYGMLWYGIVWYGMVWYGIVWYGKVYFDAWYATLALTMANHFHFNQQSFSSVPWQFTDWLTLAIDNVYFYITCKKNNTKIALQKLLIQNSTSDISIQKQHANIRRATSYGSNLSLNQLELWSSVSLRLHLAIQLIVYLEV
jgi:hypothetical protein